MHRLLLFCTLIFSTMSVTAQSETSVLFIGNSFTFMNNMPFTFKSIAEAKGKKIYVDTVVEGGKNFEFHASQTETYRTIKSRKWDYIVIQGHSNELAQPDSKVDQLTYPYAKKIVDSIRAYNPCAQIVLYMTWGYKYGNPKWSAIASYDSMQYRIKNQYFRFSDLLNARISPVGEVWKTLRSNYSGINLYDPDNQHPSPAGSYVSACTFFASIFGESPMYNSAHIALDEKTRQIIELNASQIVLNNLNEWRFVPQADPMQANFDLVLENDSLSVINRSSGYTALEWHFGDGHISAETNPVHIYQNSGKFTVKLKLINFCKTIEVERLIDVR